MASFRIHEDQENTSLAIRKENAEVFAAAQRRALGDLSHFACNQNRNIKLVSTLQQSLTLAVGVFSNNKLFQPGLTNGSCKVQDETRTVRQIKNEKNIVPPVAQFRAFSVYEDKPSESEVKKREPTFKPFIPKDTKKESFFISAAENVRVLCAQTEKQSGRQTEEPPKR